MPPTSATPATRASRASRRCGSAPAVFEIVGIALVAARRADDVIVAGAGRRPTRGGPPAAPATAGVRPRASCARRPRELLGGVERERDAAAGRWPLGRRAIGALRARGRQRARPAGQPAAWRRRRRRPEAGWSLRGRLGRAGAAVTAHVDRRDPRAGPRRAAATARRRDRAAARGPARRPGTLDPGAVRRGRSARRRRALDDAARPRATWRRELARERRWQWRGRRRRRRFRDRQRGRRDGRHAAARAGREPSPPTGARPPPACSSGIARRAAAGRRGARCRWPSCCSSLRLLRGRRVGRDAVAVPALLASARGSRLAAGCGICRWRCSRAGCRSGAAGAGRSVHGAGQPDRVVSGAPHRVDDRRLRQHADAVHGGHAQHAAPPPSRRSSRRWPRPSASSNCAATGKYRDLMALVEFGNRAYVITPFTSDYDNMLLSISLIGDPVEYSMFPDPGTVIAQRDRAEHRDLQGVRVPRRVGQPDGDLHRRRGHHARSSTAAASTTS